MRTIVFSVLSLALFSCDRANDSGTTRVHLQLPDLNNSSTSLKKFSDSLTSFSSNSGISYSPYTDSSDTFNSIVPTNDGGKSPVNCVFVAVSSPDSKEEGFNDSYCGRSAANLNQIVNSTDVIVPEFTFGPYQGLYYLNGTGNTIDIDVPSGKLRQFTLFGFNAQTQADCISDVANNKLNKINLSKPFVSASQSAVNLSPGSSVSINLTRVPPDSNTVFYDDCHFAQAVSKLNPANLVMINTENFPFNNARSYNAANNTGFSCEAIDVELKYVDKSAGVIYPGAGNGANFYLSATVATVTKIVDTYPTSESCINATSNINYTQLPDKSLDVLSTFQFLPNQSRQKRWVKVIATSSGTAGTITINSDSSAITSQAFNFTRYADTTLLLDTYIPEKMRSNRCYEVTTYLRNLKGEILANPNISASTVLAPDSLTAGAFTFYSDSNCSTQLNVSTTVGPGLAVAATKTTFWVKPTGSNISAFTLNPVITGPVTVPIYGTTKPVTSSSSGDDAAVSFVRAIGKSYLQNSSTLCSPLYLSIAGPIGIDLVASTDKDIQMTDASGATTFLRNVPLRIQVADSSGPEYSGYSVYTDDLCASTVFSPIGSTALSTGSTATLANYGTSFIKLYIKPSGGTVTYGPRRLLLYFGGSGTTAGYPLGTYEFELTNPFY
ncbi:MAG: hypothetical protein ACXWQQ_09100 [Pseudobdellovibrio sp.]